MTAKRRLVPITEVKEMLDFLRREGFALGGQVDIRSDGVTFYPPAAVPTGNAYDQWKAQDQNRDRPPRRQ